jgi:UPF0755 protein
LAENGKEQDSMKTSHVIGGIFGAIFRTALLIAIAYAIYRGAIIAYDYGYRVFTEPAVSLGEGRVVTVAVTKSMSAVDIGRLFEDKGLVREADLFAVQYLLSEYREDVQPGIFELSTSMTADEMLQEMAKQSKAAASEEEEENAIETNVGE